MEDKIREIIRQVGDIGEKVSRLMAERDIPEIELDIILADLRVLYENVRVLRSDKGATEARSKTETPPKEASVAAADPQSGQAEMAAGPESDAAATDPRDSGEEVPTGIKGTGSKAGRTGSPSKPSEKSILADKYKSGQTFINESLAGKRGNQDISSKIQSKPIRNIGSALGINDRFKLINELFNGDKDSFQNTIGILDGAANFNEAFTYINTSFDWDMEEDSVQLLLDLVRRKFIINQNE